MVPPKDGTTRPMSTDPIGGFGAQVTSLCQVLTVPGASRVEWSLRIDISRSCCLEGEDEEKLYPRMKQRVTFHEEDMEEDLQENEAMSAVAAADLRAATAAAAAMNDLVQNPLHTAPGTNAPRIFGAQAI